MALINVNNLTFGYEGNLTKVFENVFFSIDTNWRLGLIGRNGKGKTTLLNLLQGKYEYRGTISKNVEFDYFPFEVKNKNRMTIEILNELAPNVEDWEIIKELNLLNTDPEILYRNYSLLSGGEQVKSLLSTLFVKGNNFLLIDEPTNHLDIETKNNLIEYLKKKKSFILVSHDREFLDKVVDHIIAINNTNIEIQKGNFSTWQENRKRQDNFEKVQNQKLKNDIQRLERASKNTSNWSDKVEKTKKGTLNSGSKIDTGYVGHKSAKMMKKSKVMEKRRNKAIEEKSKLLNNVERNDSLEIKPLISKKKLLILAKDLQIKYNDKPILDKMSFEIDEGDRIAIMGKNGVGKSSILKLINGKEIKYNGNLKIANELKISYVSQSTDRLKGTLKQLARKNKIDEGVFKAMLVKMGISNTEFEKDISNFSEGQKKKVLLAKSITEKANIYIWDEPLNYVDILTRVQIEEAILKYKPTLIFVEHDKTFVENIATKIINLTK